MSDKTKQIKESLYHAAVLSGLSIGYAVAGKTLLKMAPPSINKFDINDMLKLTVIVSAADMTKDYMVKQKIIPDNI